MARLRSKMLVPTGGWFFQQGDIRLAGGTFDGTVELMRKHRRANGMSEGDPEKELAEFTCWRVPQVCDRRSVEPSLGQRFESYSGTLKNLLKTGMALVDQVEANRRAEICLKCPANQHLDVAPRGCCGKNRVRGLVDSIARKSAELINSTFLRNKSTPADAKLFTCVVCGCPNKAAVWIPNKAMAYNEQDHQRFREQNVSCWKVAK